MAVARFALGPAVGGIVAQSRAPQLRHFYALKIKKKRGQLGCFTLKLYKALVDLREASEGLVGQK
jgi:hypothetical protein